MKTLRSLGLPLLAGLVLVALVLVGVLCTSTPVEARPPGPECGPTYLWVCSGPGGPDVLFGGTVCEKAAYEKETGLTCVPYGG